MQMAECTVEQYYFAKFLLFMVLSKMFAMTQFICPVRFQLSYHTPVSPSHITQQYFYCGIITA